MNKHNQIPALAVGLAFLGMAALSACSQQESAAPQPAPSEDEQPGDDTAAPEQQTTPEATTQETAALDPRAQFSACAVCHTVKEGERSLVGPNLFGIAGKTAGAAEDFVYSKAMRESGIVWTDENLDAFITNPQKFLRGNRMAFVGERNAEKRAAIIEYLKSAK